MVQVLYAIENAFMRKTFEAIDEHVGTASAYVPLQPETRRCTDAIREIEVAEPRDVDANVRAVDPEVVVYNTRFRLDEVDFYEKYPLVHVRHGASVGRGEAVETVRAIEGRVAAAFAPGERWARRYRAGLGEETRVSVVGVPEADGLVASDAPRESRVLYAPTNHRFGGGSYCATAEAVLDAFEDSDYYLMFRPHPHDRRLEPARSVTERCRERIADMPNVTFDERETPRESMREADVLVSDCSGLVVEWLHTGRPLVQLTDVADSETTVPEIGHVTPVSEFDTATVDRLYRDGYDEAEASRCSEFVADLGVPMDGRAGERAAREVVACAQ